MCVPRFVLAVTLSGSSQSTPATRFQSLFRALTWTVWAARPLPPAPLHQPREPPPLPPPRPVSGTLGVLPCWRPGGEGCFTLTWSGGLLTVDLDLGRLCPQPPEKPRPGCVSFWHRRVLPPGSLSALSPWCFHSQADGPCVLFVSLTTQRPWWASRVLTSPRVPGLLPGNACDAGPGPGTSPGSPFVSWLHSPAFPFPFQVAVTRPPRLCSFCKSCVLSGFRWSFQGSFFGQLPAVIPLGGVWTGFQRRPVLCAGSSFL